MELVLYIRRDQVREELLKIEVICQVLSLWVETKVEMDPDLFNS